MKVAPFSYHDPENLPKGLELLAGLENARLLAGGQSLVPYLAFRTQRCDHLIDLNAIPELTGIQEQDGRLVIGAMTRQREIASSPLVSQHCPIAQDALHLIGHIATRTRGTLGGSLSNMDPSAELFGVSALHDATFHIQSVRGGRDIAVADWAETFMKPVIAADEMLTSVSWLPWPKGHGHAFLEFSKRHHDYAIVAAGALMTIDADGRINRAAVTVIGCGIAPTRLVKAEALLLGQRGSDELFAEAAHEVETLAAFPDSFAHQGYPRRFVSADYRRQLGLVLVRRAMECAYAKSTYLPRSH
jgi:aerobic carbon-monoxide dehydrogenase medium subunit